MLAVANEPNERIEQFFFESTDKYSTLTTMPPWQSMNTIVKCIVAYHCVVLGIRLCMFICDPPFPVLNPARLVMSTFPHVMQSEVRDDKTARLYHVGTYLGDVVSACTRHIDQTRKEK
jgi:hypothetical protein